MQELGHVKSLLLGALICNHGRLFLNCPLWVDCVEKVGCEGGVCLAGAVTVAGGAYMAGIGSGIAINLAILRRFWAVAARRNSSWAPQGPRSRNRPSLRMRLRWANSISTFLRSRREVR